MNNDTTNLFELPMSEARGQTFCFHSPNSTVTAQKYVISSRTVFGGQNRTQFLLVLSGRGSMRINDTDYPIKQGILSVLGKEDMLTYLPDTTLVVYGYFFSEKLFPNENEKENGLNFWARDVGSITANLHYYRLPRGKMDVFLEIFNRMLAEVEKPSRSYLNVMRIYVQEFCFRLQDLLCIGVEISGQIPEDDEQIVEMVKDYIDRNYQMKHTYDSLSRIACISRAKMFNIFKDITGKTMSEYVAEVRIGRACAMIIESDRNILDIMLDVGYNDMKRFCKRFKEATGLTPSEYRKLYR